MSDNIKVAIRVRPLISREKNENLKEQWEINENSMYPIDPSGKKNGDSYFFDHIFGIQCCNEDIYNTVARPVVDAAMNGFNGTIFAYGQTSSGKTYTMMGCAGQPGVIALAVENIFLAIEQSINKKFLLRVSYMEIYNEKINDLLDIKNVVKVHEDYSGSVIVNVKEEVTDCAEQVYSIMKKGDKAKKIGETMLNEKSSRSHTIFRIIIESSDLEENNGVVHVAHLNLVDLAGSERATLTKATGMRLKEGAQINKSLSALSLVMKQLSESQEFINFRDSKLTRILQPSLGGNALTAIICGVTPAALEETISTLAFASRAKSVKNKPHLNEIITDEALINRYALEINKLKEDLEKANDNRNLQAQLNTKLEEKISVLEKCIIYSSRSPVKKKTKSYNRRKTWSAPHSPNRALPVIFETHVLKFNTDTDSNSFEFDKPNNSSNLMDNLDAEDFPYELFDIDSDKCCIPSTEKKTKIYSTPSGLTNNYQEPNSVSQTEEISESSVPEIKDPEDIMKWLVNETETPKSILRERTDYYEREYTSLIELTKKERELLLNEVENDTNSLKSELNQVKTYLEIERNIRNDLEMKFQAERNVLQSKVDEFKKKNAELSRVVFQAQKDKDKNNDCEYLVEVYKEKYKKREKELLDSLEEARESLRNASNNTTNLEQHLKLPTDIKVSQHIKNLLEEHKIQLNTLREELDSRQPVKNILKIFSDISQKNEDILSNSCDCPEEILEFLTMSKYIFEIASALLNDDTLVNDMEREKTVYLNKIAHLQQKERTYDLLVKKQDEELKHLSENILEYMEQLQMYKSEIDYLKNSSKLENNTQTDLDDREETLELQKIEINLLKQTIEDLKKIPNVKIENPSQTHCTLDWNFSIQNNEIKDSSISTDSTAYEEISEEQKLVIKYDSDLLAMKDKEIEELSDKIMEYLEQLTDLEEELEKYKSTAKTEQFIQTDLNIQCNNAKVEELNNITNKNEEEIFKCKSNLEVGLNLLLAKDAEIENLNDKISSFSAQQDELKQCKNELQIQYDLFAKNTQEIENLTAKIQTYVCKIAENENKMKTHEIELQRNEDLISKKTEEISALTDKINVISRQLVEREDELQCLTEKNQEIETLTEKISTYESKLAESEIALKNYRLKEETDSNKIQEKDEEIKTLMEKIFLYSNQIENNFTLEQHLVKKKNDKIKELNDKILEYLYQLETLENELRKSKLIIEEYKNLVHDKDKEITILSEKVEANILQLALSETNLNESHSKLEKQLRIHKEKDEEIKELANKIVSHTLIINQTKEENKNLIDQINTHYEIIDKKDEEIQKLNDNSLSNQNALKQYELEMQKKLEAKDAIIKKLNENMSAHSNTESEEMQIQAEKLQSYQIHINKLKIEHDQFKSEIESKDVEIQKLTEEIEDNKSQLVTKDDVLKEYNSHIEEKKNTVNNKNEEIKQLSLKVTELTNKLHKYLTYLQINEDLIKEKDIQIENASKTLSIYSSKITSIQDELTNCKINLTMKDEHISQNEININNLIDRIKEYENKLTEIKTPEKVNSSAQTNNFEDIKNKILHSESEKWQQKLSEYAEKYMNLKTEFESVQKQLSFEENKSIQYFSKIQLLESELVSCNEMINQLNKALEIAQNKNIEYSTTVANLTQQITYLQQQIRQKDDICIEQKYFLNNIQSERDKQYDNNTYLSKIHSLSETLKEKNNHLEKLEQIIDNLKNNPVSTKEIEKLRKENNVRDKTIEKMTQKANAKITNYQNILTKIKSDNEMLKNELNVKSDKCQTLENTVVLLQSELGKKTSGSNADSAKLQSQINKLKVQNEELVKLSEHLQEQTHKTLNDINILKKKSECLRQKNIELLKSNNNLEDKLINTEELLKSSISSYHLLEKEKENYIENTRMLEETLEDVKFELYELKTKERDKMKREKRQSLHDSSRNFDSEENALKMSDRRKYKFDTMAIDLNKSDEDIQILQNSPRVKADCERCKQRLPFTEQQIKEKDSRLQKLESDFKSLRKKHETVKDLCKIRKNKIEELERQLVSQANE